MKMRMVITSVESKENRFGEKRTRVTFKPYATDLDVNTLTVTLKPLDAKHYRLDRQVIVSIELG